MTGYMQLEQNITEEASRHRRHLAALCCTAIVVVAVCTIVAHDSKDPAEAENLFSLIPGKVQGSINRGMQQRAFQPAFRTGGQYAQFGGPYRPQQFNLPIQGRVQEYPLTRTYAEPEGEDDFKGAASWSKEIAEPEAAFDILKIKEILPHRYPFLLVDKIIEFVPGKKAVGIKKVTTNEEFFNGHFPHRPIMPGVLQIEAMAQVGGIIALQQPVSDGKGDFFFGGVDKVKWRRPVVPGDTLVMEMELVSFKERYGIAKMKGASYVDGKKVVEGEFTFAMVKG